MAKERTKSRSKGRIKEVIIVSFLVLLFLVAVMGSAQELHLAIVGEKTKAGVVDVQHVGHGKHPATSLGLVFKDGTGTDRYVTKFYSGTMNPIFYNGQTVSISYDKQNPFNLVLVSSFLVLDITILIVFFVISGLAIRSYLIRHKRYSINKV